MKPVDIIIKKKDKLELTREEIEYFIQGLTKGDIPDYQISAWAMAVLLNGMTDRETTDLTLAMVDSGEKVSLEGIVPIAVDKHSTGGVGDKTTLVTEPIVAACGLPVGKMSGRGLGFSGGTLDKVESIPGYRTDLNIEEFKTQLKKIGVVLTGQSANLAPADGKLYALRDVTGTVQSIPLIASSVMSKKIAAGAQAIVLDVKVGVGAFMKDLESARELSRLMISIGRLSGRKVVAVLADMNQPLGFAVGNALELKEAIETLQGNGPKDFTSHCIEIAGLMLKAGNKARNREEGNEMAANELGSGRAFEKIKELVSAQGGDVRVVENTDLLPKASIIQTVVAPQTGYLSAVNAREVGETTVEMGAGRITKGDRIDHSVGVIIHHKVGDFLERGQPLFTIHASGIDSFNMAKNRLISSHKWSSEKVKPLPHIYEIME